MTKPTICLDFDGVVHNYIFGWEGITEINGRPSHGALEFLIEAFQGDEEGYRPMNIAIFSVRSKNPLGRRAMKTWLRYHIQQKYGTGAASPNNWDPLHLEVVRWIRWPWFKPPAIVTLDDRAVTFEGVFPPIEDLLNFTPWNRQQT